MTVPHAIAAFSNGIILHTDPTGQWQVAAWYTVEDNEPGVTRGELRIGRVHRGQQRWGVDHEWFQVSGTLRTNLGLPVGNDDHNFPAIAVDGLGKIHVWCDMHASTMRHAVTIDPHTANTWQTSAGWEIETLPNVGDSNTYPFPTLLPDGTLLFYARSAVGAGGSGASDAYLWTRGPAADDWADRVILFQGLSVPDAKGPGIPGDGVSVNTEFNWSPYPTLIHCESPRAPHPGRLHMFWLWRTFPVPEKPNFGASYARSDDAGVTWQTIGGQSVTLPITPLNNIPARVPGHARITSIFRSSNFVFATLDTASHGITVGMSVYVEVYGDSSFDGTFTVGAVGPGGFFGLAANQVAWVQTGSNATAGTGNIGRDDYINNGHVTIDPETGNPHIVISQNIGGGETTWHFWHDGIQWQQSVLPAVIHGFEHTGSQACMWHAGDLWMLKGSRIMGQTAFRRPRLWNLTGAAETIVMGGEVIPTGGWEPSYDPQAYRLFGTIEILTPDGNTPRVTVIGRGPRAIAADAA